MGGCSALIFSLFILPFLIIARLIAGIFGLALLGSIIAAGIFGLFLVIVSVIVKTIISNKLKNGETVHPATKILSTITLIIGIVCSAIAIITVISLLTNNKSIDGTKQAEYDRLYNKILAEPYRWTNDGFVMDGRKVIRYNNFKIPESKKMFSEGKLIGTIVLDTKYNIAFGYSELKEVRNPGHLNIFISNGYIFIYEDEKDIIENYYANSKKQKAVLKYAGVNRERHSYNCDYTIREAVDINKHLDNKSEEIIIDKDDFVRDYYYINLKSEDRYFEVEVKVLYKDGRYYLMGDYDKNGQTGFLLTEEEENRIKNLIETYEKEEYMINN